MDSLAGIVITGATATGKTDLAIAAAQKLGGEIISMDSRQVYKGMDIGTAKATAEQRAVVPHFGIDLVTPDQRYSAGRFAADARRWIAGMHARGRVPVLVGGTGFFLRALTQPMFREPSMDARRKEALERYFARFSREELRAWLEVLDPVGAERLSQAGGRQRLARALEVALLTGQPLSWWQERSPAAEPPLTFLTFVLELPRDVLYQRINQRVHQMVENGLVDEVCGLARAGYSERDPGMNATGYIELLPCCRGETTLNDAVDAIQRATRRYARRQLTWFRHQLREPLVHLDASAGQRDLVEQISNQWRNTLTLRHEVQEATKESRNYET